jgi:imidazolonepropionase-like amidohydrolase
MAIALMGGTILDGTGAPPFAGAVVIEGDAIVSVGDGVPDGATRVDVSGKTVMPGLIDCHSHVTHHPDLQPEVWMKEFPAAAAIRAARVAKRMLMSGITSFRDAGTVGHVSLGLVQAIEAGEVPGPTIVPCGHYISMTGRDSWGRFRPEIVNSMEVQVTGADEARRAAREQIRRGAKAIKVMATGLVGSDAGEATDTHLTVEEMRAAVEEAEKAGLHAFSHAHSAQGCWNAVEAGVRSLEHGSFLDERTVELMLEKGTYLVPTKSVSFVVERGLGGGAFPDYYIRKLATIRDRARESFLLAKERGVPMAMGSDSGGVPFIRHENAAFELEAMVNEGLEPAAAIVAATGNAADCVQLFDRGRLAPGKRADVLVVDGAPHEDVTVLQDKARIQLVLKDGNVVRDLLGSGLPLWELMEERI